MDIVPVRGQGNNGLSMRSNVPGDTRLHLDIFDSAGLALLAEVFRQPRVGFSIRADGGLTSWLLIGGKEGENRYIV